MELSVSKKSPFSRYREGYTDGFNGNKVQMPNDKNYMNGYAAGYEDDTTDTPEKFQSDTPRILEPSDCRK